jgi:MFS family permease
MFDGYLSFSGWQWLFIVEGVPSVLVGLWALRYLTDKPIEAAWLVPDERVALQERIDHERKSREAIRHYKLGETLTNPRVLGLSLAYVGHVSGTFGLIYWLPQIIKGMVTETSLDKLTGVQINALTGYLVAVPFAFAIVATVLWARHSDITHERVWHAALPEVICGLSLIAAAYLINPSQKYLKFQHQPMCVN